VEKDRLQEEQERLQDEEDGQVGQLEDMACFTYSNFNLISHNSRFLRRLGLCFFEHWVRVDRKHYF
jgi:hypothetical protein